MKALIPICDGSESLETVAIVNILRRAEITVTMASITGSAIVEGTRAITLVAEALFDDVQNQDFDLITIPGGDLGTQTMAHHPPLIDKLRQQRLRHQWYGGICAAPARVLSVHGLLDGKQATCYPTFRDDVLHYVDQPVVVDGHCITGQGPAAVIAYGLALVRALCGEQAAQAVAEQMVVRG